MDRERKLQNQTFLTIGLQTQVAKKKTFASNCVETVLLKS
jgi:hypothetical protein